MTSHREYDRVVSEWLARDRQPLMPVEPEADSLTVVEVLAAYKQHAKGYYRKQGVAQHPKARYDPL